MYMYMYLAITHTKEGIETPKELLATNQHTQSLKGQLLYYHISDTSQSRGHALTNTTTQSGNLHLTIDESQLSNSQMKWAVPTHSVHVFISSYSTDTVLNTYTNGHTPSSSYVLECLCVLCVSMCW